MTTPNNGTTTNTNTTTTTTEQNAGLSISSTPVVSTITVNVGVPGNMKKFQLEGSNRTVADALTLAGFNPSGYEIRMGGQPVQANAPLEDGRTILLLRPVKGNN
jgi:sulfur carrier protein ThiS